MRDQLSLGPTPTAEPCEQLGAHYDAIRARQECKAFMGQLRRTFGDEPVGARLRISSNAHDFGTYHEVEVVYADESEKACEYAYRLERETPEQWDEQARNELSGEA